MSAVATRSACRAPAPPQLNHSPIPNHTSTSHFPTHVDLALHHHSYTNPPAPPPYNHITYHSHLAFSVNPEPYALDILRTTCACKNTGNYIPMIYHFDVTLDLKTTLNSIFYKHKYIHTIIIIKTIITSQKINAHQSKLMELL